MSFQFDLHHATLPLNAAAKFGQKAQKTKSPVFSYLCMT